MHFGEHLHTLGRRCQCGHLTIPVSFHSRDSGGNVISDGKGEAEYLRWLGSAAKPDYVNPPVMEEIKRTKRPEKELTDAIKRTDVPETAVRPSTPGPRGSASPRRGRPKKWGSDAERKRAERRG